MRRAMTAFAFFLLVVAMHSSALAQTRRYLVEHKGFVASQRVEGNADGAALNSTDLRVTKSGPAVLVAGAPASYTVTVTNLGPADAPSVTLTDGVPPNTTFFSASIPAGFSCSTPPVGDLGTISCSAPVLASGASAMFTFTFRVNSGTSGYEIANVAMVDAAVIDPDPLNNTARVMMTVAGADLSVSKTSSGSAPVGGTVTYTIVVTNNGPSDAFDVAMSDPLPSGTTFASATQNSGPVFNCFKPPVETNGTVTCTIDTLAAGAAAQFTIVANIPDSFAGGALIENSALALGVTIDPNLSNNTSTVSLLASSGIPALSLRLLVALALAVGSIGVFRLWKA